MKTNLTATIWSMIIAAAFFAGGCSDRHLEQDIRGGRRIVSLAPSITEIVYALGAKDELVGRTSACDYPSDVRVIPVIGGFGVPSMELLMAARPTLVLYTDLDNVDTGNKMDKLGVVRRQLSMSRLNDIPIAITTIGELVDRRVEAERLASGIVARIGELRQATHTNKPVVFVEIWSDPLMTAGSGSFVSDLVALAGGVNMGDRVDKDYFKVSSEWIVAGNPDIILCVGMSGESSSRQSVMARSGWGSVKAVRTGRVYDRLKTDIITRPGPRLLDAVDQLRNCIEGKAGAEGG